MSDKQPRQVIYGPQVHKAISSGVTKTYKAVATTLGSKGRNVGIEKNWGAPLVMHDGVTVAREMVLSDPFENMAAQMVISAAQSTNDQAGDGTTTATILTYAIVKEGLKQIAANVNPQIIRKGIEKATTVVIAELEQMATEVKTFDEMKQVATISAADEAMGELIATAIQKVGKHGVVTVQEGASSHIEVEYKEGMEFQQGYISPYMITDGERQECVLEGGGNAAPYIVVVDEKLSFDTLFNKVLNPIVKVNPQARVVVIANDFDPDAKATMVANRIQQNRLYIGVKSPEYGEHRTNMLHDIALLTGATVIGGDTGIDVEGIAVEHFGRATKMIITRDQTMIIGGGGKKEELQKHIKGIRQLMKASKTEFEKDKLEARLAKLVGGVAVINVGAQSEVEMRELKERVYDAVNAVQAAVERGIVPGGGVALVRASSELSAQLLYSNPKDAIGMTIVRDALMYPMRKLVDNSGGNSGFVLEEVARSVDANLGYNVDSEAFENMLVSGIIDPVKVTLSAFKNAASTATMLLTMECMIAFQREEPNNKPKAEDLYNQFPD